MSALEEGFPLGWKVTRQSGTFGPQDGRFVAEKDSPRGVPCGLQDKTREGLLELVESIERLWVEEEKEAQAERVAEGEAELERRAQVRFPGAPAITDSTKEMTE